LNTQPLSPYFLQSQYSLSDQSLLGKRKTLECNTSKTSTDEKIKKTVTFAQTSKCYFYQNIAPTKCAIKAKSLINDSPLSAPIPIEEVTSIDLKRYNPSIVWILKCENHLFKQIKSLLTESCSLSKKQHLLEMLFLRSYLSIFVKESIKDLQNLNIIDDQEDEWIKASVDAIALNLMLQFNDRKKIQIAIDWINRLIPDDFLPELKEQLILIAENIPYLYQKASCKSRSMIYPQDETQAQISASDASCFWVRFLSLNPYSFNHIKALFIDNPLFLKNIQDEIVCLASRNGIDFSEEFKLNIQLEVFHDRFFDFCNGATVCQLNDFFNRCLMKDHFLATLFPIGLNFTEVLECFDRIGKGIAGRFIRAILSHKHPKFQLLQERMHIDHAVSFLHDLDQIQTSDDLKKKLTLSLLRFPYKKKQSNGPSDLFIDKDILAYSLAVRCLENRSSQAYYFWNKLFTLYPHYKKIESVKQIFSAYLSQSDATLKQSLECLGIC
jgi:hypothetical protein